MSKFEGTYQHPLIVCKHNLNIKSIEKLGEDLSNLLNFNIEIDDKKSSINKVIHNPIGNGNARLIKMQSLILPEKKFHLQLDEIVLFIFGDFLEIKFDITLDYFHLLHLNERNELKKIELLETFFKQLKLLGIDEVHFSIFAEFEKDEGFTYCWKNIYRIMSKYDNYFKLEI